MTDFMFLSKLQIHHFPLSLHMLRAMHTVLISLSLSLPLRFISGIFVIVVVSGNAGIIYSGSGMVRKEEHY